MSYGTSISNAARQAGAYLPVTQSARFELGRVLINLVR
jgi:hypothetical protein